MRYILFTIVMVVFSVGVSDQSLNFSRRSNTTLMFPHGINALFLGAIPRLLFMTIPFSVNDYLDKDKNTGNSSQRESRVDALEEVNESRVDHEVVNCEACMLQSKKRLPAAMYEALDGLDYMVEQMKATEEHRRKLFTCCSSMLTYIPRSIFSFSHEEAYQIFNTLVIPFTF